METILWALDLAAVGYLCFWALRTDKAEAKAKSDKATSLQGSKNA